MKRINVKSSNIKSVGYDEVNKVLEIEFNNSGVYHYEDVDPATTEEFLNASSLGKTFNRAIKNSFKCNKGEFKPKQKTTNFYIAGKAGAGKTKAAEHLIKDYGFIQAKIAGPVYGLARDYFGMTNKDRPLLQMIGTDAGRVIDTNIWVNRFIENAKIVHATREKMGLPKVGLVCDDCRFLNEHEALKAAGWVGIFLDAPDEIRISRLAGRDGDAQVASLTHSSEVDVEKFQDDLIQFDASGSIADTNEALDKLMETIGTKKEKING
jgi:dephospho-CoA kinase